MAKQETADQTHKMVSQVFMLQVADCIPTPDNRPIDETTEKFRSLFDSVEKAGVQVPIIVRPHPADMKYPGKFEIRDGEQRWRCAKAAGHKLIKAEVRLMNDTEALALTIVSNIGREDLLPRDEGRMVARMMDEMKGDADAVAVLLGHTPHWVRTRAHLRELIEPWAQAMTAEPAEHNGAKFNTWTTAHWVLLARLPKEAQQRAYNEISRIYDAGRWSVKSLEHQLADQQRLLSKAPWRLDDDTLIRRAGPCCSCVKRSSARGNLFYETVDPEAVKADDRCLDSGCWDRKAKATAERRVNEAKAQHPEAITVSTGNRNVMGSLNGYQWHVAQPKEKGAVEAIQIDGPEAGKVLKVVTNAGAVPHAGGPAHEPSLEDRIKQLEERHRHEKDRWLHEAIGEAYANPTRLKQPDNDTVIRLAAAIGVSAEGHDEAVENYDKFTRAMLKGPLPKVYATLWRGTLALVQMTSTPQTDEIVLAAGGVKLADLRAEIEKSIPEPKELVDLRAQLAASKKSKSANRGRDGKAAAAGEREDEDPDENAGGAHQSDHGIATTAGRKRGGKR